MGAVVRSTAGGARAAGAFAVVLACAWPSIARGQPSGADLSGGVTSVGQWASDERARPEAVGSVDLFVGLPLGRLRLVGYVEANTTPRAGGVSRLVGEANTDAGTALSRRRRGRVQLSELRLVLPLATDLNGHLGLLDATGFLDVSRIANDENLYFLGVPFVNNPTIEFPDYALGAAADGRLPGSERWRIGAVLTSSHGLADNAGVSYAQLLDVREKGKGLFGGVALRWRGEAARASLGAWANTADHPHLDRTEKTSTSRGGFTVLGWFRGAHSISARAGLANGAVSHARGFAGLTYLWALRPNALGVAAGRTFASPASDRLASVSHFEGFLRRRLYREVFVTASIQRIVNSGFDPTGDDVDARLWVVGARFSAAF